MRLSAIGLILILALGILTAPLTVEAQQATKVHRIGTLSALGTTPGRNPFVEAFLEGMRRKAGPRGWNAVLDDQTGRSLLQAYHDSTKAEDGVPTPLMILHNDKDGAVDQTQGIEYFNTLRRLNKPVILLEYKGENHGLARPANRKDYTVRMREFFDHHLMDKAAPAWLKEGVPHLQHDEHLAERVKD